MGSMAFGVYRALGDSNTAWIKPYKPCDAGETLNPVTRRKTPAALYQKREEKKNLNMFTTLQSPYFRGLGCSGIITKGQQGNTARNHSGPYIWRFMALTNQF